MRHLRLVAPPEHPIGASIRRAAEERRRLGGARAQLRVALKATMAALAEVQATTARLPGSQPGGEEAPRR